MTVFQRISLFQRNYFRCSSSFNNNKLGKIVCVVKNYVDHVVEMGGQRAATYPILMFLKPSTTYIEPPGPTLIPCWAHNDVRHEVELGLVISKPLKNVSFNQTSLIWDSIGGFCLALDMTCGKIQADAKRQGFPWTAGKAYDTSCPMTRVLEWDEWTRLTGLRRDSENPADVEIWCRVNNEKTYRQKDKTSKMIHSIPKIVEYISSVMTLEAGDVILTGTPVGIGNVYDGDIIHCGISGVIEMKVNVKNE